MIEWQAFSNALLSSDDFGVGVDTEPLARWRELLPALKQRSHARLFSEREHVYCESFADPAPAYAGNWCAKEATFKAISRFCRLSLDQIEIVHREDGSPMVQLPAPLAKRITVRVSISHDPERAIAFAVARVDA
jgi:phosphopantetheine--protein transferase-like protein